MLKSKKTVLLAGLLTGSMLISASASAKNETELIEASYSDINIYVNGTKIDTTFNEPFIYDGSTYLPIRAVAESLDKKVDWDENTRSVYISSPEDDPLQNRKPDGGMTRIFRSITCIGDSLTSGAIDLPQKQADGTEKLVAKTVASKSYPTIMQGILGIKIKNLGIGGHIAANDSEKQLAAGATPRSWAYISLERGTWKNSSSDSAEAYIIALGTNDISRFGEFTGALDTDVIISENGLQVKDNSTSVGGYCEIINMALTANPEAKIFCVTLPNTRGSDITRAAMNTKIRDIVKTYRNTGKYVYLIDLERYGIQPNEVKEWKAVYYNTAHLNEEGYKWLAETYMTYIDYIIRNNIDDFL